MQLIDLKVFLGGELGYDNKSYENGVKQTIKNFDVTEFDLSKLFSYLKENINFTFTDVYYCEAGNLENTGARMLMSDEAWSTVVKHAKECCQCIELYLVYMEEEPELNFGEYESDDSNTHYYR